MGVQSVPVQQMEGQGMTVAKYEDGTVVINHETLVYMIFTIKFNDGREVCIEMDLPKRDNEYRTNISGSWLQSAKD